MMDLGRLRALHAVSVYGTVLAAASALHCTPSAVSQHLGKLEREVGAPLVERDGRRLRLTELGLVLAGHAARVLATVEEAEAAVVAHSQTVTGRIRVVSIATACRGLVPHALASLAARHPELTLAVREGNPDIGLEQVQRGHADLAVVDDWPEAHLDLPAGTSYVELGLDVADLLAPAGRFTGPVRLAELFGERWIAATPGAICHTWLTRVLPGVQPDFLVDEFATQFELIRGGFGIALVPRLARTGVPDGIEIWPVLPIPTRRLIVVWRTAAAARPAVGAVVSALREAWTATKS
ncbi:LysR family transcriptional regulator [Longispora albida]|uniref:LysR family transcriptional regulator n=1 Tax=Longispora albida TaxID=203523 RepID=UPI0003771687|nr:LysR substrate-binding domain-containing protein [Longispora albida]